MEGTICMDVTPSAEVSQDAKKPPRLINRVRDHLETLPAKELTVTERFVVSTVAGFADDDGSNAFPAQEKIAGIVGISVRQARRVLGSLVTKGYLDIQVHAGGKPGRSKRRPNLYRVALPPSVGVDNHEEQVAAEDADMSSDDVSGTSDERLADAMVSSSYRTSGTPLPDTMVSADLPALDLTGDRSLKVQKVTHPTPQAAPDAWWGKDDSDLSIAKRLLGSELRRHFPRIKDHQIVYRIQKVIEAVLEVADAEEVPLALNAHTHRLRRTRWRVGVGLSKPLEAPKALPGFTKIILDIWERDEVWEGSFNVDMSRCWVEFIDSDPDDIGVGASDQVDFERPSSLHDTDEESGFDDEMADAEIAAWEAHHRDAAEDISAQPVEAEPALEAEPLAIETTASIVEAPPAPVPAAVDPPKLTPDEHRSHLDAIRAANPGLVSKRKPRNVQPKHRKETAA
jgi:hypothetical protein